VIDIKPRKGIKNTMRERASIKPKHFATGKTFGFLATGYLLSTRGDYRRFY